MSKNKKDPRELFAEDARKRLQRIQAQKQQAATQQANAAAQQNTTAAAAAATRQFLNPNNTFINRTAPATTAGAAPAAQNQDDAYVSYVQALMAARQNQRIPVAQQNALQRALSANMPTQYTPYAPGGVLGQGLDVYNRTNPATQRTMQGLSMQGYNLSNEQLQAILSGEAFIPEMSGWDYTWSKDGRTSIERGVGDSRNILSAATNAGWFDNDANLTPENIGLVSDRFLQGALNSEQYRLNEQLGESQYDNSEYLDYLRSLGGTANLSPANRSWASGIVTDNSRYNSIAQGNKGAGFAWAMANEVYNLYESNQEYYDLTGIDRGYPGVIEAYLDYTASRYDKDADDELMIANALALNHIISGGDLANYDEEQALAWYDSLEVEEQDELLAWALGAFSNRSLGYENVPWGQPEALGQLGGQYAGFDIWEGRRITNAEVRTQEIQTEVDRLQRAADERAELASIQSDLDAEILAAGYNISPEQLNAARDEVNTNYAEFLDNTGYGNLMTADELIRYTYLKTQDPSGAEADEYIELLKDQKLLEARSIANRAETTLYAEDPLFAVPTAVGSVAAGVGDIVLAGGKAFESMSGNANPYSRWHDLSHYKGDVRFAQNAAIHEAVKEAGGNEGLADVAGMGYDVVMAGADMMPAMAATALTKNPAAGAAVLGAESYSGAMTEAAMRGYDPVLTQAYAIGTAAIEALTEKVSIEALLKNPTTLLGTIGRNFVTEGTEEIASGALNIALDTVANEIAGNETEFEALYRQLQAEGRENAFTDALAMTVGDLLYQGAVGGLTGGMLSTPGAVLNSVRNYSTGAQIVKNNAVDALLDEASAMGPGSEAAGMAEEIRATWAEEAMKNAKKKPETVTKAEAETETETEHETAPETTSEAETPAETPEAAPASRAVVEEADGPAEASRASEEATEPASEATAGEAEEKKTEKVGKAKLGRLYQTLVRETQEQYGIRLNDTAVEIIANAIREQEANGAQLDKRVGSAEIAQGMIDAVARGGKLTGAMGRYIKSNPALKGVYEQYQKGIPQLQMRQMELTALHGAKLQKLQGMAAKPGSGKSGKTAGGATPAAKEYTDAAEEVRTETDEAVESLTRRKNPSDKHSKVITFATREGLSETGELKRVERHDDGLYLVVARGDEEVSVPVDSAEAYGGAKEDDYALKQVSAGSVARVIDYAHRHSEMTTEEINALVGLMESTANKKVTSSQLIATYEAGVRAGYTGDAKPALETVARTPYGDKAVQALETALEMGHGMGVRQALTDEKTRTEGISTRARGEGGVTFMGEVENTEDVEDTGKREAVETIMKDLSPQQNAAVRVLQSLSETSGIGITLFQTKAAHGEELHTPNGFYDPKTNSIFIDLQAGASRGGETMVESAILKTASHELTHYIEMNSQDGYAQLRTEAKKLLSERGKDYGKLITEKLNTLTHTNTRAQAEAEVIADACEMMLKDSTAAETMAKSNPRLWKTMTNWLKDFVTSFARRVKRAFSGITATSEEAQALTEIRDGVERYVGNMQKLWDNALVEAAGKKAEVETATRGDETERKYQQRSSSYNYAKNFEEQVDDWLRGDFPSNDALLLGRTPELYRKIGLGDLPMTINQTHVDYVVNGTKDADHYMGEAWLKKLPDMMENPVAIIRSESDPKNSVIVILSTKINGKQIIAPVFVNGNSINNGLRIDSNNIATVFGKDNALTKLLTEALNIEASNNKAVGVYYWNKTEARSLYEGAGLQLPGSSIQDGLIHSIFDAGADVNRKMVTSQTESQQFRRWFGNSVVRNEDGSPKVMYHGTAQEFWAFDKKKATDIIGRRLGLGAGKDKFYLTEHLMAAQNAASGAESMGKGKAARVMELYVSAQKVMDRTEYERRLENEYKKKPSGRPFSEGYDYRVRDKIIAAVDAQIRAEGYDGVWDRESGELFVYESEQIKSATDNVGTFDPANPDIRYSQRRGKPDLSVRDALMAITDFTGMTPAEDSLLNRYQGNVLKLQEVTETIAEKIAIRDNKETPEKERAEAKTEIWRLKRQKYAIERALIDAENEGGYAKLMTTAGEMVRLLTTKDSLPEVTQALQEQIAKVTEQLAAVQAELGEMSEEGMWNTINSLFDQRKLRAAARRLKALYGSRISEKTLMNRIVLMQTTLLRGGENASAEYMRLGEELVRELRSKSRQDNEMLSILKEHIGTIELTETQRQEINNTIGMKEFLSVVRPVVKIVPKGKASVTLDVLLDEANAAEGGANPLLPYFEGHMSEGDSIMRLYNLVKSAKTADTFVGRYGQEQLQAEMVDVMSIAAEASLVDAGAETVKTVMDALTKNAEGSDALTAKVRQLRVEMTKAGRAAGAAAWKADERHKAMGDVIEYLTHLETQEKLLADVDTKRKIERQVADESNKRIKEIIAERDVMERNRVMRERIRRTVGWMVTRIRRETDRKNVPEELKPYIEDAIRIFVDFNDVLRVFKKSEVSEIKRIFDALKKYDVKTEGTLNDLIAEELDGAFKELRVNLEEYGEAKTKGHKKKTMLSNQSLKAIDEIVEILWGQITKWNEIFIGGKQAQLSDVAERTVAGLNTKGDYAIRDNVGGRLWEKVVEAARNKNMTPIYFFNMLEGNDVMQTMNDDVVKGQREYGVQLAAAKKKLEGIQAKYNYWTWKNADPLEFTTEQGRRTKDGKHDLSMTVDEAMSVWAIWKREEDTTPLFESTHLSNGGIVLQEGKRRVNGKLVQDNTPHKLSEADMAVIDKWLTAEQKAYAEAIVEYMSKEMAEVGNRASMRMFGIRKFKEAHYFPMRVQRDQLAHSSNKAAKNPEANRIAGMASAHRRVERAWKPLAISSFTEVAANHINDMLLYGNFAVPIENFNSILNYNYTKHPSGVATVYEDSSSMTVRALFRQKYGDNLTSYLETYLADLNGGTGVRENSKLMSLYKRSAVMASVSVAIQQPWAIIRAWFVQNPKYYIKAISGKNAAPDHKEWEQLCKYSGEAVLKGIGGFDMTSTRNMGGYLAGTAEDTYSLAKKAGALVGVNVKGERLAGIKRQADELLGLAAQKADQMAWTYMWMATKAEVAEKNPGMDTNSEEFLRMAADRFGEVVNLTQVYDSTLVRSQNMRSKSNWTKALTAFMAESTLTLNMLLDGWNRKDAKSVVKAAGIVILLQLATAAVKSLWTAGRDDDEEKPWVEKYLAAVGGELGGYGGSLNPLNLIPYARDVMSVLEGYDVERADMTLVDQLVDEAKKWADGKYAEDPAKGAKNMAFALSNLLGIPTKNIWRDVTTGINTWKDMTTDKRDVNVNVLQHEAVSNFLPWVDVSNDAYYTKLYQAMQKGDTEEVEALREFLGIQGKSEKTVNTGVKGVVKNLYKGQHLTDEEAKTFLLEHGLVKDEKEAFKAVDEWKEDGMYEGTEGEEKRNYSPYDTIYWGVDAMNGADIEEAIKELVDNGWTDKSVRQELRSHINELYREGSLTKAQARKLLTDHGGLDEDDMKDEDYWYWYFDKQDFAQGNNGSTEGYTQMEDLYAAVDAGSAAQYRTAMKELTTHGSTEKEVQSEVYSYLGEQYMDGEITASQLKSKAAKYAGKSEYDQNDWHWEMKKWDFGKRNGGKTGDWAKYDDFYTAVESGKNLKAVTKEYLDHGVDASTLAGRITDKYKDEFVRLYKTNKTAAANLQNRILNAYAMLGYDREKKLKDIAKWLDK